MGSMCFHRALITSCPNCWQTSLISHQTSSCWAKMHPSNLSQCSVLGRQLARAGWQDEIYLLTLSYIIPYMIWFAFPDLIYHSLGFLADGLDFSHWTSISSSFWKVTLCCRNKKVKYYLTQTPLQLEICILVPLEFGSEGREAGLGQSSEITAPEHRVPCSIGFHGRGGLSLGAKSCS